jgi:hypothetical protein
MATRVANALINYNPRYTYIFRYGQRNGLIYTISRPMSVTAKMGGKPSHHHLPVYTLKNIKIQCRATVIHQSQKEKKKKDERDEKPVDG